MASPKAPCWHKDGFNKVKSQDLQQNPKYLRLKDNYHLINLEWSTC